MTFAWIMVPLLIVGIFWALSPLWRGPRSRRPKNWQGRRKR